MPKVCAWHDTCGSGLAREDVGTSNTSFADPPLSRASPLPQVSCQAQTFGTPQTSCGSELARDGVLPDADAHPALRNASTNSCLRIFERPGMFFARATFIRLSTVWAAWEALLVRG